MRTGFTRPAHDWKYTSCFQSANLEGRFYYQQTSLDAVGTWFTLSLYAYVRSCSGMGVFSRYSFSEAHSLLLCIQ